MDSKTATFNEITFPVQGMFCGSCAKHVKAALEGNSGVKTVEVNLTAGEVTVSYNPQSTGPVANAEAIQKSGHMPRTPRLECSSAHGDD